MSVRLVWVTPDAETMVMRIARVSSEHPDSDNTRLLGYLIRNKHWSPFETISMCVEVNTTRDIGRQMLRHRSFTWQEWSQRYAKAPETETVVLREARTQDTKKRQRSHELDETAEAKAMADEWVDIQHQVYTMTRAAYNRALELGIAKEQARVVLPEGLTTTKMYMAGTIRSFIHYVEVRATLDTQKEHREIAEQIKKIMIDVVPHTARALGWISAEPVKPPTRCDIPSPVPTPAEVAGAQEPATRY